MNPPPSGQPVQDDNGKLLTGWSIFFSSIFNAITALESSGTTAQRPVKGLFIGRTYFDTTLGYRIDYNGENWVNSTGATV